jgi:hypothetical protein
MKRRKIVVFPSFASSVRGVSATSAPFFCVCSSTIFRKTDDYESALPITSFNLLFGEKGEPDDQADLEDGQIVIDLLHCYSLFDAGVMLPDWLAPRMGLKHFRRFVYRENDEWREAEEGDQQPSLFL